MEGFGDSDCGGVSVGQVSRGVLKGTRLYQRGYGVLSTPTKSYTGL